MATYEELFRLSTEKEILNKVSVAAVVKSEGLISAASPTNSQITWANNTLSNPVGRAKILIHYVLAANKDSTEVQIREATDAAVQTNVDDAVDKMIAGGVE